MFLVHFQQQNMRNCILLAKLIEFPEELVEFMCKLMNSVSFWPELVEFCSLYSFRFWKINFCIKYHTKKPRIWYHCWVFSKLTLLRCSCNPRNLGSMSDYNTCKIIFPRFTTYLAWHGVLLNIKEQEELHTFDCELIHLEFESQAPIMWMPLMEITKHHKLGKLYAIVCICF